MADRATCDLWLWDGVVEYEGALLSLEGGRFSARVRPRGRDRSGLGRPIPASPLDLQRSLTGRRLLVHVREAAGAALFEVEIQSVQPCGGPEFQHLFAGRCRPLAPHELEALAHLPPETAAALLQRRVS